MISSAMAFFSTFHTAEAKNVNAFPLHWMKSSEPQSFSLLLNFCHLWYRHR